MPSVGVQIQPNWTLLRLIQEFCRRQNLAQPPYVTTSTDEEVTQLWGLLNEGVMALQTRGDWPQLNRHFEFIHQHGESYLALNLFNPVVADNTHDRLPWSQSSGQIKYPTRMALWDKSTGIPVAGPLSDQDWAAMLAQNIAPALYSWRMNYLGVCIYPYPPDTPTEVTWFAMECTMRETVMSADQLSFNQNWWRNQVDLVWDASKHFGGQIGFRYGGNFDRADQQDLPRLFHQLPPVSQQIEEFGEDGGRREEWRRRLSEGYLTPFMPRIFGIHEGKEGSRVKQGASGHVRP